MTDFDPTSFRAMSVDGYDAADGVFRAHYTLRGRDSGDVSFTEVVDFGAALGDRRPDDRLLRLLALTCSPSYFKAAAPPVVEIAFPTRDFERHYLSELVAGGLGEFAYRNSLPDALTPTVTGPDADAADPTRDAWDADAEPLVPVGGGKDSVVSIEALKGHGFHPTLFSVNKFDPIDRCIEISGLDSLRVTRRIDPALIEANARGAHNGHVPVTAINSVIGLIVADANGLGPVVLSNERSSNVGNVTWLGRDVNHQWSKSISYETLLRDTLSQYGLNPDRYFSLLRPLSESEIADRFKNSPQYFRDFIEQGATALTEQWQHASSINMANVHVTAEQLHELHERVNEIVHEFVDTHRGQRVPGSRPVLVQFYAFPVVDGVEIPDGDSTADTPDTTTTDTAKEDRA